MKRAGAATLLCLTYPLLGCRQVLDVDDYGTKPRYIGKTDNYAYVSGLCRDCVYEKCEDTAVDCFSDPGCQAQAECLAGCRATDHECRGRCSVSTPSTATMAALVACQAEHCGTSMPEADRCAASLALRGNAECDRCFAGSSQCGRALEALSRNAAALEYERCREICTCHGDCPEGAPGCECPEPDEEASSRVSAVATCCTGACNPSIPDWSCVGSVKTPPAPPGPLELNLRVTIPYSTTPIANLQVRACSGIGTNCNLAEAPAMTGTDGWATLKIPQPGLGDRHFGHLRLTSDEPDYSAPALFYFFPPVHETRVWLVRRMVARTLADDALSQVPGLLPDWDNNGGIVFSVRSCNARPQNLQIISTPNLPVLYFAPGPFVDPTLTETSSAGSGFMANAPPGTYVLRAQLPTTGKLVGEYTVSVVKGSLTHIVVEPTEL